ncbi:ABC transporter permease [Priestia taiwanensis]|uniref:ABC transporter permease n=1 Tax=Priestia taiwanensis TaxID=1347902 RepID=A0A917AJQ4_9BACI|nr:ABC-2 family transporter protein [Priestia taiwanensis]MBM7361788.1 ABC-2 type transport system permease protein [Priestia taiwanensis]GGE57008.1 hypothetical protein GCM10007140_04150 [Priestia taiwanensis]
MKYYLNMFFTLKGAYLKGRFSFHFNFIVEIIGVFASAGVWLAGIMFAMKKYGAIGGWEFPEILLLISLFYIAWALASILCLHLYSLITDVRTGNFVQYMVRPLPPLFYYIANTLPIHTIGMLLSSIGMFIWANTLLPIEYTWSTIFFLIYSILGGTAIIIGTFILNSSMAFRQVDTIMTFENVLNVSREMSRLPLFIYPPYLKWILVAIVPYGLVGYIPIHFILKKEIIDFPAFMIGLAPLIGFVYLGCTCYVWNYMMKKYDVTGS